MAQRDWRFWLKVLIGAAFGLLIADVLLFTLLDAPLLKSQQVRASTPGLSDRLTQTAATQALILPTYDPLKPRPSPTPRPTATPWLIARVTATPAPTASGPPGTSTLIPANAAEFGVTPEASGAAAPATPSPTVEAARPTGAPGPTLTSPRAVGLVVTPTPTLTSPVAIEGTGTPTPTLTPPEAVEGTGTPTPGATPVPTETPVVPDDTPGPTPLPDTPEPSPTVAPGDFAQFTAYVQDHYNSIAGQPLEIGAVTSFAAGDDAPVVTVEVIGDGTNSVFAQTPAAALDYGRRLLNDTKSYFDGQPCAVSVVGKYDATDPGPCNNNPSWCTVGERNPSDNSWSIAWTYIRGKFIEGSDTVETWNEGS